MWKIKGYRGKRSDYRQAFKVSLKRPKVGERAVAFGEHRHINDDRIAWCEEHCVGAWHTTGGYDYWFERCGDAIMFKLVWGGAL